MAVRLNKYIADCGVCSRRAADKLILDGQVKVNKKITIPFILMVKSFLLSVV